MTILKCKLCGGNIELTGASHGVCDSCGTEVTLPKIDDDKRADMYNRGNYFRQIGDFDKAYSAYEHIIASDQSDAEAHWCLMLCRYGVEYVKDTRTGDYKPTVSRMSYDPILNDPDYLAALAASDEYTKELYRREVRKIESIQRQYLEISRKEDPYDVFICFKAEVAGGGRTRASVLAQDIYERLTDKGVKVFFSRITLENKLTEAYEPYIFAALHSAKVMLLVADEPEQLQGRWVKNEWSRYLAMMDRDRNKHMLPVFEGMSPYDFPQEIPMVHGQDMTKIGAMQDLVRGVMKITGHLAAGNASMVQSAAASDAATLDNLMRRAAFAEEDGEYEEAQNLYEQAYELAPENGTICYRLFLLTNQLKDLPEKVETEHQALCQNSYFKKVLRFGDENLKEKFVNFQNRCESAVTAKYAQAAISEIGRLEKEKSFGAALSKLDDAVRKLSDMADNFRHIRQLQELRPRLERAYNEKRLRENYKAAIGEADSFLYRKVKENHGNVLSTYENMERETKAQEEYEGVDAVAMIGAIVLVVVAVLTMKGNVIPFALVGIALAAFIGFCFGGVIGVIIGLVIGGNLVPTLIENLLAKYALIAGGIVFVLAAICLICFLNCRSHCAKAKTLRKNTDHYFETNVKPLEANIRKDVAEEWESKVDKDEVISLMPILDFLKKRDKKK